MTNLTVVVVEVAVAGLALIWALVAIISGRRSSVEVSLSGKSVEL